MARIIGRFSINPFFFITGKSADYFLFVVFIVHIFGLDILSVSSPVLVRYFSYLLFCIGLITSFISMLNLGNSISVGIPNEKTLFKTNGLYNYSRNPMYLGFNIMTLSSIILTLNPFALGIGLYSIIIYHFIIIAEEKFLLKRFGASYSRYCRRVGRYI